MISLSVTTAAIVTGALLAPVNDHGAPAAVQDLLDRGFEVVAEGKLIEFSYDACVRYTMQGHMKTDGCAPKTDYGSFKRLKSDNRELVCVSFRGWACYLSDLQN